MFAVKEALARGFQQFLLVGVIGGRLDHTLGNVSLLLMLHARGKAAAAIDDYSEMEIVSNLPVQIDDRYAFFSLLNISGTAQGITIKNAKYPLRDAEITCEYQRHQQRGASRPDGGNVGGKGPAASDQGVALILFLHNLISIPYSKFNCTSFQLLIDLYHIG